MAYLFITTFILTIIAFFINDKEIIAPGFLFSASFFVASLFCVLNIRNWGADLNEITYWVIVLGILEFILVSGFIRIMFKRQYHLRSSNSKILNIQKAHFKIGVLEVIQILFILIIMYTTVRITGEKDIFKAINLMNYSSNGFISESYTLPTYAKMMQTFNLGVGILGEYLFLRELIINKNFSKLLFIEIFLGFTSSLLNGSRGGVFFAIIAIIVFILLIQKTEGNFNVKKYIKTIFVVFILILITLLLMKETTVWVGRGKEDRSIFEYISIYIGAEIKNLDIFISNQIFPVKTDIFGQQTFITIYDFLIKHMHLNIQSYTLNLPFQIVNGFSLGNVYTTFYPWLYDFGYQGVFILTFVMATISEIIYEYALKSSSHFAPYLKLFYGGTIAPCVAFAFFSNRFFEAMNIINISLTFLIWMVLNYLFRNDMYYN